MAEAGKFVALAASREEFNAVLEFAARNPAAGIECVCLEFWPAQGHCLPNVALSQQKDFLSKKELDAIDERALFFSRSWHGFESGFEKAIAFNGICLGFVSDFAIMNIFKAIFLDAKSALNAVRKEKAAAVLGVKGSFSGECAAMAAHLAYGKTINEALAISAGEVIKQLKGLPENHLHCSILAVSTLYRAIADYLLKK